MSTSSSENIIAIQWYPLICHLPASSTESEQIAFLEDLGISKPAERKIKSDSLHSRGSGRREGALTHVLYRLGHISS